MTVGTLGALIALSLLPLAAHAIDPRCKDANGDLVADTPTSAAELIDPPVLVFSYTPVEDPLVYAKVRDGFLQHMAKVTGKPVQFFQCRAMRPRSKPCAPGASMWRA
jgi:phosphonate transport system substrate-binding protein